MVFGVIYATHLASLVVFSSCINTLPPPISCYLFPPLCFGGRPKGQVVFNLLGKHSLSELPVDYLVHSPLPHEIEKNHKTQQSNRGHMRDIHETPQFFEAGGPQGHFFEKKKLKTSF